MKKSVIGKSNAKIILLGDHSVVYGQPAIALPLPSVTTTVQMTATTAGQTIASRYFDGPIAQLNHHLAGVVALITTLLERFDGTQTPFHMTITSDLPAERGMGSSAAVDVAITRAMYQFFDRPLSRSTLLDTVAIGEKITHGNPSGIDAATSSSAVPVWLIPHQTLQQLSFHLNGVLIIADSGVKGQTGQAVASVARRKTTFPQVTNQQINTLGQLSYTARECLADNQITRLGEALNTAQEQLSGLGVSSPELDHLITVAREAGALGAKLTGGGMGGCMIALCADQASAKRVKHALLTHGATATWTEVFQDEEEPA